MQLQYDRLATILSAKSNRKHLLTKILMKALFKKREKILIYLCYLNEKKIEKITN